LKIYKLTVFTCAFIISISTFTKISAKTPPGRLFTGGNLCAFYINGKGSYNGGNFNITEPWSESILVFETGEGFSAGFDQSGTVGYGWDNKLMSGLVAEIGYRLIENFSIVFAYKYYLSEKSEQFQEFAGNPDGPFASLKGHNRFTTRYRQSSIVITGQYYPNGYGLFFMGGFEYSFLRLNVTSEWTQYSNDEIDFIDPYTGKGKDNEIGYLIGIGYEARLTSTLYLTSTLQYTYVKYKGDNLLAKFKIGGFGINTGIRFYIM